LIYTITTCLPPEIIQYYNKYLLNQKTLKFYDDCSTLWGIYEYLILKIKPKCVKNPVWLAKVEKLEQKFLELYGRAKAKEDEFEKKTGKPIQASFSYFSEAGRHNPTLFNRLRNKRILSDESYMS
jgi:hypothetical protein